MENPFTYWHEGLLDGQLPRTRPHRYLTFDIDIGGLNNIRLAFEYAVVLAAVTGRTLVIPPPESWYLINHGPIPGDHQGGTTSIGDLIDLDALGHGIPVKDFRAFIAEAREHLDIPDAFCSDQAFLDDPMGDAARWKQWLLETTTIPAWIPYETLICFPDIEAARRGEHLTDALIDHRTLVELSPMMTAAPVLHLPSNDTYRSLGPVATMLASEQRDLPMLCRRLVKHHTRYRPEIFAAARAITDQLGFRGYDALHVRRNDFQYAETRLAVQEISDNIHWLLDSDAPLYIATDEDDPAFFAEMQQAFPNKLIRRWEDVIDFLPSSIPMAWVGPIEQLVCAGAREFAGTDLSTFTAYIHRIRGYLEPHREVCYYHTLKPADQQTLDGGYPYGGHEYLRENPIYWISC